MSIYIIPLTFIEYKNKHFYISHSPTNENIMFFIEALKKNNIKHVVRLCKPTYDFNIIQNENINCYHLEMEDGSVPTEHIINEWNNIQSNINESEGILVHCLAGLGRAPIIVSISLINYNMEPTEAINLIRKHRPGSLNSKQINFLVNYKPNIKKSTFSFLKRLVCY